MTTRTLQLHATATSTGGDAVCNVMVPQKGRIVAVHFEIYTTGVVTLYGELSTQSTNQNTTNDASNVIAFCMNSIAQADATGTIVNTAKTTVQGISIPIDPIQKVYAHLTLSGSAVWRLRALLYWV